MNKDSNKKMIIILIFIIFFTFGFVIGQINTFFKILVQKNEEKNVNYSETIYLK